MPKIPTNIAQEDPRAVAQGTSPFMSAAGISSGSGISTGGASIRPAFDNTRIPDLSAPGRALKAGMSNMTAAATKLVAERQEFDRNMWVEEQVSTAEREWTKWIQERSINPQPGVEEEFNKAFSEYSSKLLEQAPGSKAAAQLEKNMNRIHGRLFGQSLVLSAKGSAQQTITRMNTLVMNASDMLASSHSPDVLAEQQERLNLAIDAAQENNKITASVAESFRQSVRDLSADLAEHLAAIDPDTATDIIENAKGIDITRRTSVLNKINSAKQTHNSLERAQQDLALENNLAQIEAIGKPMESFDIDAYSAAKGTGPALKATKAIQTAHAIYMGKSAMKAKSATEITGVLNQFDIGKSKLNLDPVQLETAGKILTQYAGEQVKLMETDPYTYSLQDPVVAKAYKDAADAPEENRLAARNIAIQTSLDWQKSKGIPEGMRQPMPTAQAEAVADTLNAASPQDVENELTKLMSSYGQYYPDVFRQLQGLPESRRIDPSLSVVGLHLGKPWVNDYVSALRTKDTDFKLDSADKSDIRKNVFANGDINSFWSAVVSSNPSLTSYADGIVDGIEKYAMSLLSRGAETSPRKAVNVAAERIIASEYDFGSSNSEIYAIKRKYVGPDGQPSEFTKKELKTIKGALEDPGRRMHLWRDIDTTQIDQTPFSFPATLSEEARQEHVNDALSRNSFWVTSPDNMGVTLHIPGVDGTAAPIRMKDGSTISVRFNEVLERVVRAKSVMEEERKLRMENSTDLGNRMTTFYGLR